MLKIMQTVFMPHTLHLIVISSTPHPHSHPLHLIIISSTPHSHSHPLHLIILLKYINSVNNIKIVADFLPVTS